MNRELVQKAYQEATEYCENRIWNSGESTAWVWEEKFADLIIEANNKLTVSTSIRTK